MLVVVENGNVALFFKLFLNFKAAGSGNVLKVDAAKRARDEINGVNNLVNVLGLNAERECINTAELLKENALALHNRHTGLGADVAKA